MHDTMKHVHAAPAANKQGTSEPITAFLGELTVRKGKEVLTRHDWTELAAAADAVLGGVVPQRADSKREGAF